MSELLPERRDVAGLIADIRVDVATIKERTLAQGVTLSEVKAAVNQNISRGEYDARQVEMEKEVKAATKAAGDARDEALRQQGANRVWRWLYGAALAAISTAVVLIQAKVI